MSQYYIPPRQTLQIRWAISRMSRVYLSSPAGFHLGITAVGNFPPVSSIRDIELQVRPFINFGIIDFTSKQRITVRDLNCIHQGDNLLVLIVMNHDKRDRIIWSLYFDRKCSCELRLFLFHSRLYYGYDIPRSEMNK